MALVVREIAVLVLSAVLHSGELRGHDVLDAHARRECGDAAKQGAPRGEVARLDWDREELHAVVTSGMSSLSDSALAEHDEEQAGAPCGGSGRVRLEAVD